VIEWLRENGANHVLLHAFSGNLKAVRLGLEAGYYFSVPPSFTISKEKVHFNFIQIIHSFT
jgi:TatD DNase family protein